MNTHFDELVDAVYHREDGVEPQREDQNRLWTAFFELEKWLFITNASETSNGFTPFVGYIEEEPWFFVFTDSQRAFEFAKKFELTDKNGECLYMSLTRDAAFQLISSAEGKVQGIRVNEGPHGWFAPLENVGRIYNHLIGEGLLTAEKKES